MAWWLSCGAAVIRSSSCSFTNRFMRNVGVDAPFLYRRMPRLVFLMRRLSRANYEREMELLDLLCDRNRPGIDVGAKIGMYTYRIRRHSSEVIAFEPIPMLYRMVS